MTSTNRCVIHHWLVSVTWDLRGIQCCADSCLLGCEVMSLGKWFSVFSRHYSPLKQWNHSPSDTASYPTRPEHSCLRQSGGFVKKQMVLQTSWLHRASTNIQHFIVQLMHTMSRNVKLLKHFKIKEVAPTCFGLQGNHHQGATGST